MRNARRQIAAAAVLALVGLATVVAGAGAAAQAAPVNTTPPTISGTTKVGQTLTAADGTWSNTPDVLRVPVASLQRRRQLCVNVANGTQKTYTLVGADAATRCGSASRRRTPTARLRLSRIRRRGRACNVGGCAEEHRRPDDLRHAEGRPDSDRRQRQLDRQPDRPTRMRGSAATRTSPRARTSLVRPARLPRPDRRSRLSAACPVTARNARAADTADSAITAIVQPAVRITNGRPTIKIVSVRFSGPTVYARFRICDDSQEPDDPRDRLASRLPPTRGGSRRSSHRGRVASTRVTGLPSPASAVTDATP